MFLIDTNVLSDAHKGVQQPAAWLAQVDPGMAFISVITMGEIERGIVRIRPRDPDKAMKLEQWLKGLRHSYADRILTVTEDVAIAWGRLSAGRSRSEADALIAATAQVHDLMLVTRNVSDFSDAGLTIINPWTI